MVEIDHFCSKIFINLSCKKHFLFVISLLLISYRINAQSISELRKGFRTIPDSVKLSTYWYWINGNISKEGIEKDLISMSRLGIGTAYIGNIGLSDLPGYDSPKISIFSPSWWSVLKSAFKTADSLGMKIGLFNSPGWSQSGGPWIDPKQSMRYLLIQDTILSGPSNFTYTFPHPCIHFQHVCTLAFPFIEDNIDSKRFLPITIQSSYKIDDISKMFDGDTSTHCTFQIPDTIKDWSIQLHYSNPVKVRSLILYPSSISFYSDVRFYVFQNNTYKLLVSFHYDRTKFWKNLGFIPSGPLVVSFSESYGKDFKIVFSSFMHKGGMADILLSPSYVLPYYIEKQLGKMYPYPHPMWEAYKWPISPEPDDSIFVSKKYVDLSDSIHGDILRWNIPPGKWLVTNIGMLPTGVENSPATPEATGLEVDKMNAEDVRWHFHSFIKRVYDSLTPFERRAFGFVVADSYETGSEDWTDDFNHIFQQRYGYNPLPYLPALRGYVVGSADQSDRFLWDLRRLIADRISYQYVGTLRKMSHTLGLRLWLENYGHWGFPGEFLQYGGQSDDISGEFWAEGDLGDIELKDASSAAHIYGKNRVFAESFTAAYRPFQRYPDELKRRVDWAFTQGINDILLHVYIAQPSDSPLPGPNAPFGTEFNRNNIWFNHSKSFFDYLRRCMLMLQQGKPHIDVAYFIGEDAPVMTGIENPKLPVGYDYDWINAEVIKKNASVKDGKIVLSNGMSYRLLVLPPLSTMRPDLLKKIEELVRNGATIVGPPPTRSPSLENYPEADKLVANLSKKIWQNIDGKKVVSVHYGKGMVFYGMPLQKILDTLGVLPDFVLLNKNDIIYTHRKTTFADIYFLSNQSDDTAYFKAKFRTSYKYPQWWNPLSGETRLLTNFKFKGNSNTVPIRLYPHQSIFLVFTNSGKNRVDDNTNTNFHELNLYKTIKSTWAVNFNKKYKGPSDTIIIDTLKSWSEFFDPKIKYYSGIATYSNHFMMDSIPIYNRIWLDLGKVYVIAHVKINNHYAGDLWTYPYHLDITRLLKKGENKIQISVVNTWVNRLIGDSRLPDSLRFTHTFYNPYHPDSPLEKSGLIGQVNLMIEQK